MGRRKEIYEDIGQYEQKQLIEKIRQQIRNLRGYDLNVLGFIVDDEMVRRGKHNESKM